MYQWTDVTNLIGIFRFTYNVIFFITDYINFKSQLEVLLRHFCFLYILLFRVTHIRVGPIFGSDSPTKKELPGIKSADNCAIGTN